jgi:hypothetical protein
MLACTCAFVLQVTWPMLPSAGRRCLVTNESRNFKPRNYITLAIDFGTTHDEYRL